MKACGGACSMGFDRSWASMNTGNVFDLDDADGGSGGYVDRREGRMRLGDLDGRRISASCLRSLSSIDDWTTWVDACNGSCSG